MELNYSAIDRTTLSGKLLRLPLRLLPNGMLVRIQRGRAKGLKWIVGSSTHGCWLGTYELEKQRALERFVKPGMVVYDVGAQAGFFTLIFSRLVREGQVIAFEPLPENLDNLLFHIGENELANVQVVAAALNDSSALGRMTTHSGRTENRLDASSGSPLIVPTLSLDDAVEKFGIMPPHLIKMDVEGAESAILNGGRRVLESYHPVLFIALHGKQQTHLCGTVLAKMGYSIFDLEGLTMETIRDVDEIYALHQG